MKLIQLLFVTLVGFATIASAAEVRGYYGVVESIDRHHLVVRTTQHSTGHWEMDRETRVEGEILPGDWVFVDVGVSGHVRRARLEERAVSRAGVVVDVRGPVLRVRSGRDEDSWNVTETTVDLGDVRPREIRVGDEISVKVYHNHNLGEVRVLRRDIHLH